MRFLKGLACTAALAACILLAPAQAGSVAGFGGATEITQLANNLEMVNQSITQVRMLEASLKNLVTLQGMPQWNQSAPMLQQLISTIHGAQSIAWQSQMADQQFKRVYGNVAGTGNSGQPFGGNFGAWRQQTMSSTSAALQAAGMQASNFQTEAQSLAYLRTLNDNPQGQVQAIQAGANIAAMQVEQLQSLRAMQAAQIQMQAATLQEQSSQSGNSCDAERRFFGGRRAC